MICMDDSRQTDTHRDRHTCTHNIHFHTLIKSCVTDFNFAFRPNERNLVICMENQTTDKTPHAERYSNKIYKKTQPQCKQFSMNFPNDHKLSCAIYHFT